MQGIMSGFYPVSKLNSPRKYSKAVGPKLYKLLLLVFALAALLAVNSLYLAGITLLEWATELVLQNQFYLWMFFVHLLLGLLLVTPLIIYGLVHIRNTKNYRNKTAVRAGYLMFICALALLITGVFLTEGIESIALKNQQLRLVFYCIHVVLPVVVIWLFVLHRLAGRPLDFNMGKWVLLSAGFFVLVFVLVHFIKATPKQVKTDQFQPSLSQTHNGEFIDPALLNDSQFCQTCHADSHESWLSSAHRWASFNNAAYAFSVKQTKASLKQRVGHSDGARFCAACHDPVLFFSDQFDDLTAAQELSADAQAGITCTACHAITEINSVKGNGAYTIAQPMAYPFGPTSQLPTPWLNELLIKSKPNQHKKTYLKPLHKTSEFCSTCHKVFLPESLNQYRWLRGQNHYDSFMLSGVSGHGVKSFYYPPEAKENCAACHMPLKASNDFGAKQLAGNDSVIHDHAFAVANTAIRYMNGIANSPDTLQMLKGAVDVELFAIKDQASINADIIDVFSDDAIDVKPGGSYLIETLLKTIKLGHAFTQGTADSNQVWIEFNVYMNDELVAQSGGVNAAGEVDDFAYFANAYVIDKDGNQIKERNPEDIFTALYNHQIPPGSSSITHYQLDIPQAFQGSIRLEAKLHYRKFNTHYYRAFSGDPNKVNDLPTVLIAADEVTLNVTDTAAPQQVGTSDWKRWNDYGIALLRSGALKQAELAFQQVTAFNRAEGWVNLARLYIRQGQLEAARQALDEAAVLDFIYPWQLNYYSGRINFLNGDMHAALADYLKVLSNQYQPAVDAGFDFSKDYTFLTELAETYYHLGRIDSSPENRWLTQAAQTYAEVLRLNPDWSDAYYGLAQIASMQNNTADFDKNLALYQKYKTDDQARNKAISEARRKDPAADKAANQLVIYPLSSESVRMPFATFSEQHQRIEYL